MYVPWQPTQACLKPRLDALHAFGLHPCAQRLGEASVFQILQISHMKMKILPVQPLPLMCTITSDSVPRGSSCPTARLRLYVLDWTDTRLLRGERSRTDELGLIPGLR